MAVVAGDGSSSPKPGLVDVVNHPDHSARRLLQLGVIGIAGPVASAFVNMTLSTIHARGGGKETHRAHEFPYWNSLGDMHVLEQLRRHRRLLSLAPPGRSPPPPHRRP